MLLAANAPRGAPVVRSELERPNVPTVGQGILQTERAPGGEVRPRKEQGPGPPTEPLRCCNLYSCTTLRPA